MDYKIIKFLSTFDFTIKAALCSQIGWKGSVPRKDFPTMLVLENNEIIGTIGGGSLEYKTIELAKTTFNKPISFLEHFDMTGSDLEKEKGFCGGKTTILIELLSKKVHSLLKSINFKNQPIYIITEVKTKKPIVIRRIYLDNKSDKNLLSGELKAFYETALNNTQSMLFEKGEILYFFKYLQSQPRLHIFGAGHVGKALSDMAKLNEMDVVVHDDRSEFANRDRFPNAKLNTHSNYLSKIQTNEFNKNDFLIITTRKPQQDIEILRKTISSGAGYIGYLSSVRKWKLISEKLMSEGVSEHLIRKIYSPAGIDISSETVPEIAVSIIAEIIRHYRKASV